MAKKPNKPLKHPEPRRHNGVTWTALAVVLAAGSGTLNIGGWVVGIDPASNISLALGGALVSACVVSEGAQLLAMSKAEKAWKAKPYRQSARFGALIFMGVMCAGWNGYSAHRAIDALNANSRAEFMADYTRNTANQSDELLAMLEAARTAQAELTPAQSPFFNTLTEQTKSLAGIPVEHSTNRNKMADKIAATSAQLAAWMTTERKRLADELKAAEAAYGAELARIEALSKAADIPADFQIGLSIGMELAKLVFLWAGQVEISRRKARKPINWAAHFITVRQRFGRIAKILPFKSREEQRKGLNALGLHGKRSA